MNCTRCQGTGFLNLHQIPSHILDETEGPDDVLEWIERNEGHDVQVCDCCGDGGEWYGEPGEHYGDEDPQGIHGPYAYNGGFCECN